jgi:hypothetical protein
MRIDLKSLEEEARRTGEAFLPLLRSEGARVGLNARTDGNGMLLEIEAQLCLLPPRSEVDLPVLRSIVDRLAALAAEGFHLHHYGDGWVVAARTVSVADADGAVERVRAAFPP